MFGGLFGSRKEGKGYTRNSPRDEFEEFTNSELQRLHNSDIEFDEELYRKAVELVLEKLKGAQHR